MISHRTFTKNDLVSLAPKHATFVGIDSDGCVFDTMEIKQKQCFHGLIVSHWKLGQVEKEVREAAEFVNLYSKWRGQNRFIALVKMFDLLRDHPGIAAARIPMPDLPSLRKFMASGAALGNPELEKAARETGDPELQSVLQWSKDVNALIAKTVRKIPPFPWVRESLDTIARHSDMICVSQTPTEALVREWEENDLMKYPAVIAGQELGTKTEHLAMAAKGKYPPDRILMIGDAPGDRKAARENKAHFYPVNPAREKDSWERFYTEAYDRFLCGTYAGAYEDALVAEFEALLPEQPKWKARS